MNGLRARELTASGRGGLSVVEVRGAGALERVRELCPGARLVPGTLRLARIENGLGLLDEALVVTISSEAVELHVHGSPPLVRSLLQALGAQACGGPQLLSLEERAAALLRRAPSESGARILLDQAEGALRRELEELSRAPAAEQDRRLAALLERGRVAQYVLRPASVVLLGPANAGKSTLFNALVGCERVLVGAQGGTTRDVVLERARLGPYPIDLADSPGERAEQAASGALPGTLLEAEGRRLARRLVERADLVLWLTPATAPPMPPPEFLGGRAVQMVSCADLLTAAERAAQPAAISALSDPAHAAATLADIFRARLRLPAEPWSAGAPVLFEAAQLARVRLARRASPGRRSALLSALLLPARSSSGDGS